MKMHDYSLPEIKISTRRVHLTLLLALYAAILCWSYCAYLVPTWGYFGLELVTPSWSLLSFIIASVSVSAWWAPLSWQRPAVSIYWLILVFAYAPMQIGVGLDVKFDAMLRVQFMLWLAASMLLAGGAFYLRPLRLRALKFSETQALVLAAVVALGITAYIYLVFRGVLQFVGLHSAELYELRFENREVETANPLAGYFILWAGCALWPILISCGLMTRRPWWLLCGIAGQVFLYMTLANRMFLFSIILTGYVYWLTGKSGAESRRLIISLSAGVVVITAAFLLFDGNSGGIIHAIASIFIFRAMLVSSLMGVYYYDFFQSNPVTYFSHVTGVNRLMAYPYNDTLGVVVGTNYLPVDRYNANANFFLTDGIAAMGVHGLIVAGALFGGLLYLCDCAAARSNPRLASLLFVNVAINLMNVSIFTSIVSGGLFLVLLWLQFRKEYI